MVFIFRTIPKFEFRKTSPKFELPKFKFWLENLYHKSTFLFLDGSEIQISSCKSKLWTVISLFPFWDPLGVLWIIYLTSAILFKINKFSMSVPKFGIWISISKFSISVRFSSEIQNLNFEFRNPKFEMPKFKIQIMESESRNTNIETRSRSLNVIFFLILVFEIRILNLGARNLKFENWECHIPNYQTHSSYLYKKLYLDLRRF